VPDWLTNKLSQLDISYAPPHPGDAVAGTRIDPRVVDPRGLSWTVVTPPGAFVGNVPDGVRLTTTERVSAPMAVRPDGIAADDALTAAALGIDLSPNGSHHQA
jgi:hypothetical protein